MITKALTWVRKHIRGIRILLWVLLGVWFVLSVAASKGLPNANAWTLVVLTLMVLLGPPTIALAWKDGLYPRTYIGTRMLVRECIMFALVPILGIVNVCVGLFSR